MIPLGGSTLERPSAGMPSARHERPHGGAFGKTGGNDETDYGPRAEQMQRQRIIGAVSRGMEQPDPHEAGIRRAQQRARLARKHQPGALVPPIRMPALRRPPVPAPSRGRDCRQPRFFGRWRAANFLPAGMRRKPFLSMDAASPSKRRLLKSPSLCSIRKGPSLRPDPAIGKSGAAAAGSKARAGPRDRKIFCPLPLFCLLGQKIPDPPFDPGRPRVPHASPQGGTLAGKARPLPHSPLSFNQNYKSSWLLWLPVGMWAKRAFPRLAQQNGGSGVFGCKPIVRISTGNEGEASRALAGERRIAGGLCRCGQAPLAKHSWNGEAVAVGGSKAVRTGLPCPARFKLSTGHKSGKTIQINSVIQKILRFSAGLI